MIILTFNDTICLMNSFELNYNQFLRNYDENKVVQEYFKTRHLSEKITENKLVAFCPPFSRYSFPYLKGRLIVPIKNVYGEIIALAGRQIPELEEITIEAMWNSFGNEPAKCQDRIDKWKRGKWINEPYQKNRNLFFLDVAKDKAREKNYIILTEGYFDVYSLYDKGIENVAAICGTSLHECQVALASRYCDNICLLMDGDYPGRIATEKAIETIKNLQINVISIYLCDGMDPDDLARNNSLSKLDEVILETIGLGRDKIIIRKNNG